MKWPEGLRRQKVCRTFDGLFGSLLIHGSDANMVAAYIDEKRAGEIGHVRRALEDMRLRRENEQRRK